MKLKFRFISLLLIISLVLSLIGCNTNVQPDNSTPAGDEGIPGYSGSPYVELNENETYFTEDEITTEAYESYSELDALGRCGVAVACLSKELMPTEERGDITKVTPTGWMYNETSNNNRYDGVYIYNRCHLIGFQLTGENANEKNLITGTSYMNINGMLPFENSVAKYIKENDNHVMYRVTPIFAELNYLADGVIMEALSVEDDGIGIEFCIFVYNVQPGIEIDYFTGQNRKIGAEETPTAPPAGDTGDITIVVTFIINKNSNKFHRPDASCVKNMKEENKVSTDKTLKELVDAGYSKCGICLKNAE